ncbi:MAG TPA: protoporphyrinogen oxidase [Longimicrobiales bacterium]|nr:protoporphyrinogen oxidase [Longimicrobiales bacterium]
MIAVVGGGISGLAVGYALRAAGAEAIVLESGGRAGGVIGSIEVEGRVLELGPQRARLTGPFGQAVRELGLEAELLTSEELPLYVWADGRLRLVPTTPRAALRTDLIGWRDRLRVLAEPFTRGLQPEETAADFFTRKFGRNVYERVIAPLYGGLYASDPADMPARHALAATLETLGVEGSLLRAMLRGSRARGAAPACSFRRGLQTLTDAYADRLGDGLRLNAPVRALTREGSRFRVHLDDDAIVAETVVLACPAGAAAGMLRELAPDAALRLERLRSNRLALVHLLSDADLRGLGYQVALGEGKATRGVTWNHAMFGRDGLYTAFLGGAKRPDIPGRPDRELAELARSEFREMTGHDARAVHLSRTWIPAWDRSWNALDGLALPAGVRVCANWEARPGVTGRLVDARRLAAELAA